MSIKKNGFHFSVLILLSLFITNGVAYADEVVEQAKESLMYLKGNVIKGNFKDIDITKAELSINILNKILKERGNADDMEFPIRIALARSLAKINTIRQSNKVAIDINQVEQARIDFDYAINWSKYPSSLMYDAGHNAAHLLDSKHLAIKYWEECAYLEHAGCMNIMAHATFTGEYGMPINLSESIKWHKKVIKTQTAFKCAGIFSINTLMQVSVFFKNTNTGDTWQNWQKLRDEFIIQGKEKKALKDINPCVSNESSIIDYIVLKSEGIENTKLLDDAIKSAENDQYINVLTVMKNGQDASLALESLSLIDDGNECHASLYLALYAKYNEQDEAFSSINDHMTSLHYCDWEQGVKAHMETEGTW